MTLDPRIAALAGAPFVRQTYLHRVSAIVERYELMIALDSALDDRKRGEISMQLLRQHPSAHLEHRSLTEPLLDRRAESARQELVNLKAAAPLPAPPERTDRTFILALADVEWLMRELIPIKRHARRVPPDVLVDRYRKSPRPDPLPDLSIDLVRAISMVPRGRMLKTATEVAGVRHALPALRRLIAPEAPPAPPIEAGEKVRVCPLADLKEGCGRALEAFGRTIAVFRDHGTLKAIDDVCPHRGGPLNQGDVENGAVICPLHGWAFDLESGQMRGNPRIVVPTYEVVIEGDDVFVGPKKR